MPVSAKALAARHNLPPRHLETVLQALVRHGILKGVRGPRGGYELARERRRITAGDIVRAVDGRDARIACRRCRNRSLVDVVVGPLVDRGAEAFLAELDACHGRGPLRAGRGALGRWTLQSDADFTI